MPLRLAIAPGTLKAVPESSATQSYVNIRINKKGKASEIAGSDKGAAGLNNCRPKYILRRGIQKPGLNRLAAMAD